MFSTIVDIFIYIYIFIVHYIFSMDNIGSENPERNLSPGTSNVDQSTSMDASNASVFIVQVVIHKDEKGYGMKVSGDNPVYVQSVKEGGPAAKAGLHAGDKIIKVNGKNVVHSTHTEVVQLIKSSSQVALTVQQESKLVNSPTQQTRPLLTSLSTRITGPQPVDHEKLAQLQLERERHYRLMIEQQRNHIDFLRSQIASTPDEKTFADLEKSEKNLQTLQQMLLRYQKQGKSFTHHKTKSSPESLGGSNNTEESKSNISSGNMADFERYEDWDDAVTPPGTPPPPYPSPLFSRKNTSEDLTEQIDKNNENKQQTISPTKDQKHLSDNMQIHAATSQIAQKPIISMEDDEISDQEVNQVEDHGHFRSLSRLWEHLPHLAVFTNYILSNWNTDPNSLLFYLLTDLYKEGNAKEMRKWAFEIHSCFLIPDAPLRLSNVDENVAREIDEVLMREHDKEEILRKVFWKARSRAKEELTKQLEDFQQKRTAGLGTIFGPSDNMLSDICSDKSKEIKMYESLFVEKLDPYVEELEKEDYDSSLFYRAAALATIFTRIFMLRTNCHQILDRVPTFVSKEKSFRTKFMGKYSRKLVISNHQFIAQQYYTVLTCNNCHRIIYGIGPQGYQCSVCLINLHRACVKLYEDACPGPIQKKERVLQKFKRMRQENEHKRRPTATFLQNERERRHLEDLSVNSSEQDGADIKSTHPPNSIGLERKSVAPQDEKDVEEISINSENTTLDNQPLHDSGLSESIHACTKKRNIVSRSESVKEQSEKRRQRRNNGRNISDPSYNTSTDLETLHQTFFNTDSGSSSNSSISFSTRLLESPSNANEISQSFCQSHSDTSDLDIEIDPINWQDLLSAEHLTKLNQMEKKRQDVLNEFILTENSHVRNLKVLYKIFYKNLEKNQVLKTEEMNLIFPNLKEVLDIHVEFNKEMQALRKEDPILTEIGDLLLKMFESEKLQNASAMFCERQQLALEFIKERRKRDTKFDLILLECEKKRQCKRLPFQAILPTEMQRLSKYPLLLERLLNSVNQNNENNEIIKLKRALNKSKDILNFVNEAAKLAFNKARLGEIQKHLDTSYFERMDHQIVQEFRSIDLTKFKLILEGGMQLRRPNKGNVPVYILLLEEAVIILHKESDRFLLKFFQSGNPAQPQPLSPIIKTSTLLVRINAVCKSALFLVNTSSTNSQMYDLIAEDDAKREMWFKYFSDAANAYNRKEEKSRRLLPDSDESEYVQDLSLNDNHPETAEAIQTLVDDLVNGTNSINSQETTNSIKKNGIISYTDNLITKTENGICENSDTLDDVENEKNSARNWPLIEPAQVNIDMPPVHIAEIRLTPMEQIKRKDEEIQRSLAEKEDLIADFLGIPRNDFNHIAEMVLLDSDSQRCLSERLMSAIYQINQLEIFVNQTLNLSEKDFVVARSSDTVVCSSQENLASETITKMPSAATNVIRSTIFSLSTQLNLLLGETKEIEDERSKLKKEIQNLRECLHAQHNLHGPGGNENEDASNQINDSSQEDLM